MIHDYSFSFQHHTHTPIAKPAAITCDDAHSLADISMVWRAFAPGSALSHAPGMTIACALGIDTNQHARTALREGVIPHNAKCDITPLRWCR